MVVNGRDKDRVASTEAALRSEGLDVVGVVGSMDTEAAVAVLTDRAMDAFGRIDLIVSTLGGAPYPLSFDAISESAASRDDPTQHLAGRRPDPCRAGARPR